MENIQDSGDVSAPSTATRWKTRTDAVISRKKRSYDRV